jgi:phosphoribosylaminoimidazolecarboxamide formyltransferase/IMP cyclohydrolase
MSPVHPWDLNETSRLALISVTDKTGIEKFGRLHNHGWKILSSSGTAHYLQDADIDVVLVEDHTKFPEMMEGRLKTLHPKIHGGLLGDLSKQSHVQAMSDHGIASIDLLVVNLYKFWENPSIENIDIGGPAMIRSAAKNFERVTVVTDPDDYDEVIEQFITAGATTWELRRRLAQKAFCLTSGYDAHIGAHFINGVKEPSRTHRALAL